ncbi:hypothetical protein M0802_000528 [Mischocyttarus mexicanus]|nr:hypothetical protein M0802_000528 [Mischocyttarus mexicanus]
MEGISFRKINLRISLEILVLGMSSKYGVLGKRVSRLESMELVEKLYDIRRGTRKEVVYDYGIITRHQE